MVVSCHEGADNHTQAPLQEPFLQALRAHLLTCLGGFVLVLVFVCFVSQGFSV